MHCKAVRWDALFGGRICSWLVVEGREGVDGRSGVWRGCRQRLADDQIVQSFVFAVDTSGRWRLPVEVVTLRCDGCARHVDAQDASIVTSSQLPVSERVVFRHDATCSAGLLLCNGIRSEQRVGRRDERLKDTSRARLSKRRAQAIVARTRSESLKRSVVAHLASLHTATGRGRVAVCVALAGWTRLIVLGVAPLVASRANVGLGCCHGGGNGGQPRVGRRSSWGRVAGVGHDSLYAGGVEVESGYNRSGSGSIDVAQVAGS